MAKIWYTKGTEIGLNVYCVGNINTGIFLHCDSDGQAVQTMMHIINTAL